MVSEDLIIGMELNFLKTKRKGGGGGGGRKGKKRKEKKEKKKEREEKGEKSERPGGGENTAGQAQKELFHT